MILVILIILGLCFGSFINAFTWRLHEQSKSKKNQKDPKLSVTKGRSICPNCKRELRALDLIPVISWLILGGKCRYCHEKISLQYPVVELTTAVLFLSSYIYWPYSLNVLADKALFGTWLVILVGLISLAVYDLKWMLLPNKIVVFLLAVTLVQLFINFIITRSFSVILDALIGALVIGGLFYFLFMISSGRWIGGGDVKLGFTLGLIAGGLSKAILVIFLASLLGSLVGLLAVLVQRTNLKTKIPFGPFLITATIFVYLFGAFVIQWYRKRFLYF